MLVRFASLVFLQGLVLASSEAGVPVEERAAKTATAIIPAGTVLGNVMNQVESFGGIPYANAPTGQLRLRPPQRRTAPLVRFDGTGPAAACPQVITSPENENFLFGLLGTIGNLPFVQKVTGQTEDCLSITVARPEGTNSTAKLPVMYYIYGGAFHLGWSSMYDGTSLIQHGVSIGRPFIYVVVNYRVAGFGFMPGKEIRADGASNLGLLDQRMGLEWVADNIAAFGGDPDKVTIWGQSAGALSVYDQMSLYGGDNKYKGKALFRGAIMSSGTMTPTEPIDSPKAQVVYDDVVREAGCKGAADTLNCLRGVNYTTFLNAVSTQSGVLSYKSVALSYLPRPDGTVLPASGDVLAATGRYAAVPMIIGDMEDEGTLFALFQSNVTTTQRLVDYLRTNYFRVATLAQIEELVAQYDDGLEGIIEGSPHRTGLLNEIFPGFKRRAALLGDITFTITRRLFLELTNSVNPTVPSWSYLGSWNYGTPILGTLHGSDILQVILGIKDNYAARSTRTYFINFLYDLDPNSGAQGKYPQWPKWIQGKNLLHIYADFSGYVKDDFRNNVADVLKKNFGAYYV